MKILLLITYLMSLFGCSQPRVLQSSIYAETAEVVVVDYETDTVTVENAVGHRFAFFGCEDYFVGDYVSMIMSDNGTPKVLDDVILDVQYSGYYRDADGFHDSKR